MLGAARYAEITADGKWIENMADAVVRAADWCETMDLCHDGLMVSPEVGDWADLLSWRGHVLFPNTLLAGALAAASRMLDKARPQEAGYLKEMRSRTTAALQDYFWVRAPAEVDDKSHSQVRKLIACQLRRRPYFLPWVGYYDYEDRFDTTGNLLAILCGVATDEQSSAILDFIDQVGLNRPYPVRVIYPPIQPGETAWREYYRLFNLNYPHQYHNGGIWPWVGGLYVAALVRAGRRERAGAELALLAAANLALKDGEPGAFNEWLHGETGKPMGARWQAWSAGMYLYACHAVESGACPGWEAARG
jgi:glycogen debranching enzyme